MRCRLMASGKTSTLSDDTVLLGSKEEELQNLLYKLNLILKIDCGTNIFSTSTQVMKCITDSQETAGVWLKDGKTLLAFKFKNS